MHRPYRLIYSRTRICSNAFVDAHCYDYYERRVINRLRSFHVKLHAYCLLPNEIYLLATPLTSYSMEHLMKSLNDSFSEYFNARFNRTSRVWNDDIRQLALTAGQSLLDFHKYIERLPLRQLGYGHPGVHPWSSYSRNAFGSVSMLESYPAMKRLRSGPRGSYRRYRDFVGSGFPERYESLLEGRIKGTSETH